MELEAMKRYLEKGPENASTIDGLPLRFFDAFFVEGLHVDLIEPGRIICSLKVHPRLLNSGNFLHGGATATLVDLVGSAAIYTVGAPMTGVSVEINVSYLDAAYADKLMEDAMMLFLLRACYLKIDGIQLRNSWKLGIAICRIDTFCAFENVQEEIEIEAKTLRVGKAVGVVSVELRKKKTGKIIAQGRHTKYLPVASKL
ncbi:hypothetical protein FEM48_Zijuj04G0201900 [Ziziphus jujuba var. spinosa]|uniref:Thioesterase domain-containing protein n=1 Tax=Ziziphus jujuba var. spinosa TaxID=714518 RepID=A0A978VLY6_ZIZJJ|nr:hypothetical protein FEM48_Zijuj04G0201900 [Ziziphus jujuba var. spinosa]